MSELEAVHMRRVLCYVRKILKIGTTYTEQLESEQAAQVAYRRLQLLKDECIIKDFSVVCDETEGQVAKRIRKEESRRYWIAYRAMRRLHPRSRRYRMWKRVADKHFKGFRGTITITPVRPAEYINLTFDISKEHFLRLKNHD